MVNTNFQNYPTTAPVCCSKHMARSSVKFVPGLSYSVGRWVCHNCGKYDAPPSPSSLTPTFINFSITVGNDYNKNASSPVHYNLTAGQALHALIRNPNEYCIRLGVWHQGMWMKISGTDFICLGSGWKDRAGEVFASSSIHQFGGFDANWEVWRI